METFLFSKFLPGVRFSAERTALAVDPLRALVLPEFLSRGLWLSVRGPAVGPGGCFLECGLFFCFVGFFFLVFFLSRRRGSQLHPHSILLFCALVFVRFFLLACRRSF